MLPATLLMGSAMATVPFAVNYFASPSSSIPQLISLISLVSLWTAGGAIMATGPTAEITDLAKVRSFLYYSLIHYIHLPSLIFTNLH